jgi:hypothetical protein
VTWDTLPISAPLSRVGATTGSLMATPAEVPMSMVTVFW